MPPIMNVPGVQKTEIPAMKPQGTNEQLSAKISSTNMFKAFNLTSNSMASKSTNKPANISSDTTGSKSGLRIKGLTD